MPTLTLPNVRIENDVRINAALKDNGVRIDWNSLTNIYAALYADNQRVIAGPCTTEMDPENGENLIVRYRADQPQYLGPQRLVIRCQYQGRKKTYDMPAFVFVSQTADLEREELEISDPEVDVELEVREVSTSLLDEALDACIAATIAAEEAARHAEEAAKPETFEQIFQALSSLGLAIDVLRALTTQLNQRTQNIFINDSGATIIDGTDVGSLATDVQGISHDDETGDTIVNGAIHASDFIIDDFYSLQDVGERTDRLDGKTQGIVEKYTSDDPADEDYRYDHTEVDGVSIKGLSTGKQDKLIAGEGINIAADGKTISASGGGGADWEFISETILTEQTSSVTIPVPNLKKALVIVDLNGCETKTLGGRYGIEYTDGENTILCLWISGLSLYNSIDIDVNNHFAQSYLTKTTQPSLEGYSQTVNYAITETTLHSNVSMSSFILYYGTYQVGLKIRIFGIK